MSFPDAVTTALTTKYADFSGRARRSEFWFYWLAYLILSIVENIIHAVIDTNIVSYITALLLLIPSIAVCVRRLHDTGRSGWWFLIGFTGIGLLFLLVWYVTDSEPANNQYGPSPKGGAEGYPAAPVQNWGQ